MQTDLPDVARIWTLDLRLSEADGVTTLDFAQVLTVHTDVTEVGPGWDYYLDRLTVAVDGGDVSDVAWDEGYTGLADDYVRLFGT